MLRLLRDYRCAAFFCLFLAALPLHGAWTAEPDIVLRPGHWVEIKDSRLESVAPKVSPGGKLASVVAAWSGGALDTKRQRMLIWGGGHSNYAGNEVYAFDLQRFQWARLSEPSSANDSKESLYPDGQPRSRHTYNYIEYVPQWDRLVSFGGSGPWPRGGGEFTRDISEFDFTSNRWVTGRRPAVPGGGKMIAAIARADPASGDVYFIPGGRGSLLRFDPNKESWHGGWGRGYLTAHATGAIDPERRLFVAVGIGNKENARQAWLWDLRMPAQPTDLRPVTSGPTDVERAIAPGFVYHPPSQRFVAWMGGTDLYTLDPASWRWEKVSAAADNAVDPGSPSRRGTYGRFQYVPRLDAFVLVNSVSQNVYMIRPDFSQAATHSTDGDGTVDISLSAIPEFVAAGDSVNIRWESVGSSSCRAAEAWHGPRGTSGSEKSQPLFSDSIFELECESSTGPLYAQKMVRVVAAKPSGVAPAVSGGDSTEQGGAGGFQLFGNAGLLLLARAALRGNRLSLLPTRI